ncbi:MAG TPA: secretin N-terminal domain-containing protein [Blastocatellia bacterium]|nr:secretin N-terminal domain-containing protein [Blastocatellia bacterium]
MKYFVTRAVLAIALVILVAGHFPVRAISQEAPFPPEDGQSRPAVAAQSPTPQPARADNYVENTGFKGRVFEVKHRDPGSLVRALNALTSGFKGASMQFSDEFHTITVRDFPENIASIEEALKRLDVAQPAQPDIEFTVHILIASHAAQPQGEFPPELNDVVRQLQSTLRYKSYGLLTSATHRAKEGLQGVSNSGVTESKLFAIPQPEGSPTFYNYDLGRLVLDNSSGTPTISVGQLNFSLRIPLAIGSTVQYENVGFKSPVSLRQGEKVVVGSTTLGDKGLVLVLSARVLK